MSMMLCCKCSGLVDTDEDCDSLYVRGYPDKCVCRSCRDEHHLQTEFDEVSCYA